MNYELSRGLRNCNPLNIRHSASKWQGMRKEQTDKAFVQFRHIAWGFRAAFCLLRTYLLKYHLDTPKKIITRWAPPNENDTQSYLQLACTHSRLSEDYRFTSEVDPKLKDLVEAMARIECGVMPDLMALDCGWEMYLG